MKIDAYKTLTAMAQSFCNKETAEKTPFALLVVPESREGVNVSCCASTKDLIGMYTALANTVVGCLKKDGASLFEDSAILAQGVAKATNRNYRPADLDGALEELEEMLDDLKEELKNE